MPYWQLYYHIVWATKERLPQITPEIEAVLYPLLASKCGDKRATALAANGMPDHVHLVAAVPPSIALCNFIKHVKGATSYVISAEFDAIFSWQRGYGVFSISHSNVSKAVAYVQRQKQHHQDGTVIPALERTDSAE